MPLAHQAHHAEKKTIHKQHAQSPTIVQSSSHCDIHEVHEEEIQESLVKQQDLRHILKSVHELHFMVQELNHMVHTQEQSLQTIQDSITNAQTHVQATEKHMDKMEKNMTRANRWGYLDALRTTVIPAVATLGLHGPLVYAAGIKTGLIGIPLTYGLVKWMLH
jgi:chromosome segregation ATPase